MEEFFTACLNHSRVVKNLGHLDLFTIFISLPLFYVGSTGLDWTGHCCSHSVIALQTLPLLLLLSSPVLRSGV